jgi:glutamate-ammonia-ligase adenylyltransferase
MAVGAGTRVKQDRFTTPFFSDAPPAPDSSPSRALADLVHHAGELLSFPPAETLAMVIIRVDELETLALGLIARLKDSATVPIEARRLLDIACAALAVALAEADRAIVLPAGTSFEDADETVNAAEHLAALALIRASAAALHDQLGRAIRACLLPGIDDPLELTLGEAGFADPITAARRLRGWTAGEPPVLRRSSERAALGAILPRLILALQALPDPDAALCAIDEIVARLPADMVLFGALDARPSLLVSLLALVARAPALSRYLVVQPALVQAMVDSSAYAPIPTVQDLEAEFSLAIAGGDAGSAAVRLAQAVNRHRFALGLQLLEATGDPLGIAARLADLAETAIRVTARDVLARFEKLHGTVAGSELVILAHGRLGGQEMTHRSDLDLIYLFTGDHRTVSDGACPLDANEYHGRVAQRITAILSTVTALGPLYQVDTRLRPDGATGLLACSTADFDRHQAERAWTWEHMALTRARPLFGSESARRSVRRMINLRLRAPRDRGALLADAVKMRAEIDRAMPASGPFDVKLVSGGLVDLEFAVHVNQLDHHLGLHPKLRTAIRALVAAGRLDSGLIAAHELLARLIVTLRVFSGQGDIPGEELRQAIMRACGHKDWAALVDAYDLARSTVQDAWRSTLAAAGS